MTDDVARIAGHSGRTMTTVTDRVRSRHRVAQRRLIPARQPIQVLSPRLDAAQTPYVLACAGCGYYRNQCQL